MYHRLRLAFIAMAALLAVYPGSAVTPQTPATSDSVQDPRRAMVREASALVKRAGQRDLQGDDARQAATEAARLCEALAAEPESVRGSVPLTVAEVFAPGGVPGGDRAR